MVSDFKWPSLNSDWQDFSNSFCRSAVLVIRTLNLLMGGNIVELTENIA